MEALEEFGLSRYESKVYVTLLSSGISDARKLSSKSGIPFGRIYDVLGSLEGKGLVEKQASRPKKFLAVEPRLALKKLLDIKDGEMRALMQKAGKIEEELGRTFVKTPTESLFWSVAVGDEKTRLHLEKLAETKRELLAYVELHDAGLHHKEKEIDEFLKTFSGLLKRGVVIKLLVGCKDAKTLEELLPMITPFLGSLAGMHVRVTPRMSNPFDVMDGEKVQLKVRNPARPEEYYASVYIWQREFAEELRKKFNEAWKEAKEFRTGTAAGMSARR